MTLHVAARAIDVWLVARRAVGPRELPRTLARAWRSLPGDAIGFIAMRACGIDAPTREVEAAGRTVALVEDPRVERWLRLGFMPIIAQTLGRYILCRGRLEGELLEHELEHVRQWSRLGPLYLPFYFGSSALAFARGGRPYSDNAFEAAARRRAEQAMAAAGSGAAGKDRDGDQLPAHVRLRRPGRPGSLLGRGPRVPRP